MDQIKLVIRNLNRNSISPILLSKICFKAAKNLNLEKRLIFNRKKANTSNISNLVFYPEKLSIYKRSI